MDDGLIVVAVSGFSLQLTIIGVPYMPASRVSVPDAQRRRALPP